MLAIINAELVLRDHFLPDEYLIVEDGEIAGSKLTLDLACRNYMKHTGASLVDAFRVASYNPATAAGLTDRVEITIGKRADLIITDHKMNVSSVIPGGKTV
jgi:N-acetylglucosamine-6-phosphate deacetylase